MFTIDEHQICRQQNWVFCLTHLNGTEVKVYAKKDGSQSGCEVYIDGELVETVSTKVNDGSNSYPLVFSKTLESGEHVIRLVPTGKFGFDALEVTGPGSVSKPEYVEGRKARL